MPERVITHKHNKNYSYETIQTRRPYYKLHGSYKSISTKETFVYISLGTERFAEKKILSPLMLCYLDVYILTKGTWLRYFL
jgi:hypothetical protein